MGEPASDKRGFKPLTVAGVFCEELQRIRLARLRTRGADYTPTKKLSTKSMVSLWSLRKEVFDQPAIVFLFNAREELRAKFSDRFGFIERQAVVHLSATEMARHAFRLEDWFELRLKIDARFRR